jgi:chromosome segregation ATPase
VLKSVIEAAETRQKQAQKAQFSELNEHFEPVFNAVFGNADSFSTSC